MIIFQVTGFYLLCSDSLSSDIHLHRDNCGTYLKDNLCIDLFHYYGMIKNPSENGYIVIAVEVGIYLATHADLFLEMSQQSKPIDHSGNKKFF